jgi:putative ABC transport system substrate-binding protein
LSNERLTDNAFHLTTGLAAARSAAGECERSAHRGSDQPLSGFMHRPFAPRYATLERAAVITAFILLLAFTVLGNPAASEAQPTGTIARIGLLRSGSPPDPFVEAFRDGLRELGYVEGRNLVIEYRWAKGRDELLPGLAADLVRLKVDVIVTSGAPALLASKHATSEIPIVMAVTGDPVGLGLVASFARPGGNITGLAYQTDELAGKWVQLLKEAVPGVSRVAALADRRGGGQQGRTAEVAAQSVGVRLQVLTVGRPDDFETAFAKVKREHAEALIVLGSPFFSTHRARLVELAARHRLPAMYHQREFVEGAGGLMSYGPDFRDLFRRAATYVDKVLKGATPGNLPVEQPSKFELVINLRTAKTLGLTIPLSLLQRADRVIE